MLTKYSPRNKTRNDAIAFLTKNGNKWFTPKEIATGIGQEGKNIVNQLDALIRANKNFYLDTVVVNHKRKRLFYGYFDSKEQAIATPPKLKEWRWRSLGGAQSRTLGS